MQTGESNNSPSKNNFFLFLFFQSKHRAPAHNLPQHHFIQINYSKYTVVGSTRLFRIYFFRIIVRVRPAKKCFHFHTAPASGLYNALFFDLGRLKLRSVRSNHDFFIPPQHIAKHTWEGKSRTTQFPKNVKSTTYFQSFYNLKIDKMVKAINLSPIIALGPE